MISLTLCVMLILQTAPAAPEAPEASPPKPASTPEQGIRLGVQFLLEDQNEDGSWGSFADPKTRENQGWSNIGTHKAWTLATTGIVITTLLDLSLPPDTESYELEVRRRTLEKGIEYLVKNAELKRVSDWDVDNTWGIIYGLEAVLRGLAEPEIAKLHGAKLREAGQKFIVQLTRFQTPDGGWGYYDDPPFTRRPTWSTTFMTAAALLNLIDAREAGFEIPPKLIDRSARAIRHSRLPNGAYTYSVVPVPSPGGLTGINQIKGSLGRIQVCNLALHKADGSIDVAELTRGLDLFFEHHRFLAVGRGRPIPHEAYYAVAGYFFYFGHYYAAGVIEALPEEQQKIYWPKLCEKILETQEADGSMWDFHSHRYHRAYGTAWGVSILRRAEKALRQ